MKKKIENIEYLIETFFQIEDEEKYELFEENGILNIKVCAEEGIFYYEILII